VFGVFVSAVAAIAQVRLDLKIKLVNVQREIYKLQPFAYVRENAFFFFALSRVYRSLNQALRSNHMSNVSA
jgi:hypothetical protein